MSDNKQIRAKFCFMMITAEIVNPIAPAAVRHCELNIDAAVESLVTRGIYAECLAFADYYALFLEIEERLYQLTGVRSLAARRLHTRRMPVVVFYTGREPGILEAYRSAYSIIESCEGCWLRDAG